MDYNNYWIPLETTNTLGLGKEERKGYVANGDTVNPTTKKEREDKESKESRRQRRGGSCRPAIQQPQSPKFRFLEIKKQKRKKDATEDATQDATEAEKSPEVDKEEDRENKRRQTGWTREKGKKSLP